MISSNNKDRFIEAGVLFGVIMMLFTTQFMALIHAWDIKPQASHGYLIMPVSLWLIYKNRKELSGIEASGSSWGLALTALGCLLYIFGSIARADSITNISLIITLSGMIIGILGFKIFRLLAFPVFFLVFMFPVPDSIYVSMTAPLKLFVSSIAAYVLNISGFAVLREGNLLFMPNVSLEVVEACSGLRSLMSYLALSVLIAYFMKRKGLWRKAVLVSMTLPVSILINAMRIIITAIAANSFGEKMAQGYVHELYGIILFMFGLFILIGVYRLLDMPEHSKDNRSLPAKD
jgi:exosortase